MVNVELVGCFGHDDVVHVNWENCYVIKSAWVLIV